MQQNNQNTELAIAEDGAEMFTEPKAEAEVTLNEAIRRGDMRIKKIVLRKPKAINLRGLKIINILQMDVDDMMKLIQRCAMPPLTEHEVKNMAVSDIVKCGKELIDFFVVEEPEA